MLYDTVRNPAMIAKPRCVNIGNTKDTIESTQQRLKREILDRFHNKGLQLPHESYVAVVQVGKYVFLAVMLPVYLCCYGIPRWLLVHLIPQTFFFVKNQTLHVGRFILKISKQVGDVMKGILEQFIGNALKMFQGTAKNCWKYLTSKTHQFSKFFLDKPASFLKKMKSAIASGLTKVYATAENHSDLTNKWLVKNALALGKQITKSFYSNLNFLNRMAIEPIREVVAPPLNSVLFALKSMKEDLIDKIKSVNNFAKKAFLPFKAVIREKIKKSQEASKKTIEKVIHPIGYWLLEKKEVAENSFNKVKKAFVDSVGKTIGAGKIKVEASLALVLEIAKPFIEAIPKGFKRKIMILSKLMPQKIKDKMHNKNQNFWGLMKPFKSLVKGSLSGCREIGLLILKSGRIIGRFFGQLLKLIKNFTSTGWNLLKSLPKKIKKWLIVLFKILSFILARVAFAGHVLVALIWVTSIYSFQLVRQLSDPKSSL